MAQCCASMAHAMLSGINMWLNVVYQASKMQYKATPYNVFKCPGSLGMILATINNTGKTTKRRSYTYDR